ncbi:MAG TPA: hypothetical protein VKG80_05980 [Trebonia sp.]|nr:hypothetical protein [Trebonia sp.]
MDSPTKTEPPFVPLRHTGWASRRTPLWVFAVIIALVAGVVVVVLPHKPSQAQRAGDLKGYFSDVTAGIESCAGGEHDSMTAYDQVLAGDTADFSTAAGILTLGAQNCSPANNESLSDFASYQVTESLAQFPLDTADNDVITWAFPDAMDVQQDMLAVLRASTPAARAAAKATLSKALATMDAQRAAIYAIWRGAEQTVGSTAALPYLPT